MLLVFIIDDNCCSFTLKKEHFFHLVKILSFYTNHTFTVAAIVVIVLIIHFSWVGPANSFVFCITQTKNAETDFSQIFFLVGCRSNVQQAIQCTVKQKWEFYNGSICKFVGVRGL